MINLKKAYELQYDAFVIALAKNKFTIAFQEGKNDDEIVKNIPTENGIVTKTRKQMVEEEEKDLALNEEALEVIKKLLDGYLETETISKTDS